MAHLVKRLWSHDAWKGRQVVNVCVRMHHLLEKDPYNYCSGLRCSSFPHFRYGSESVQSEQALLLKGLVLIEYAILLMMGRHTVL